MRTGYEKGFDVITLKDYTTTRSKNSSVSIAFSIIFGYTLP